MKKFLTSLMVLASGFSLGVNAQTIHDDKVSYSVISEKKTDGTKTSATETYTMSVTAKTTSALAILTLTKSGSISETGVIYNRDVKAVDYVGNVSDVTTLSFGTDGVITQTINQAYSKLSYNAGMAQTIGVTTKYITKNADKTYSVTTSNPSYSTVKSVIDGLINNGRITENDFDYAVAYGSELLAYYEEMGLSEGLVDYAGYAINPYLLYLILDESSFNDFSATSLSEYYDYSADIPTPEELKLIPLVTYKVTDSCTGSTTGVAYNKVVSIAANLLSIFYNATSITIPGTVKTIEDNAFANSSIATFTVSGGRNFSTAEAGTLLYDYNKTKLIAVGAGVTGTITLPSTVTSIAPNALANVAGVNVIATNAELTNPTLGGINNTFQPAATSLTKVPSILALQNSVFERSSKGNSAYGVTLDEGTVLTKDIVLEYIQNLKNGNRAANLCYIDFSKCNINYLTAFAKGDINLSGLNKNCIVFFPAGVTAPGDNIVIGTHCDKLALTRDHAYPFSSPYQFSCDEASLSGLTLSGKFSGLIFPFSISGTVSLDGGKTYSQFVDNFWNSTFTSYDSEKEKIICSIRDAVAANIPYIMSLKDCLATATSITVMNTTVSATEGVNIPPYADDNGFRMSGTYQSVYNGKSATNTLWAISGGSLKYAKDYVPVKPFTSVLIEDRPTPTASSNARVRILNSLDEVVYDEENNVEANAIGEIASSSVSVAALYGALEISSSDETSVVVTSISGVEVFNSKVKGSTTVNVAPGIYLVNGKKYIVK